MTDLNYDTPTDYDTAPADTEGLTRLPPQDIAAEQGALGGMLLSKDAIGNVLEVLKPRDYYRPAHEMIHNAIVDLYSHDEPADPITVAAELKKRGELDRIGGPSYLHTLVNSVPTAANADFYADIVQQRAVLRRLIEAGGRIVGMGYAGEGEAEKIVDAAQVEIFNVVEQRSEDETLPMSATIDATLDHIEELGRNNGGIPGLATGFADLDALTGGLRGGQMIVIAARPGMGKALDLGTALPTPTGWTTMGNVQVGDYLIGADGNPTRVVAATDVMHNRRCFEVEFSDGSVLVADAEHQWLTETRKARRGDGGAGPAVVTTAEIAGTVLCIARDRRPNHSVTVAAAAQLPDADLPLGPYTLGAWLGDGTSLGSNITTPDMEVIAQIEAEGYRTKRFGDLRHNIFLPERPELSRRNCVVCGTEFQPLTSQVKTCGRSCGGKAKGMSAPVPQPTCPDCGRPYTGLKGLCRACRADHGTVPAILRTMGVLGNKHIPTQYLRASEAQRRALLAGLLDSDGYCAPQGTIQFSVTNERLARDAWELALSLGYKSTLTSKPTRLNGKDCGTAWTVTFTTSDRVFRLPRKAARLKPTTTPVVKRRFIVDVRPVPSVPVRCVQVDNDDHMYLAGRTWIPTHNSTIAMDIARHCSITNGLPSLFLSLEMGHNEINMRILSAEAKVALHHLRTGNVTDDDWTRLARKRQPIHDAPLFVDVTPNMSILDVRTKGRRVKQKHGLNLLVVDYLQLMAGGGRKAENRQLEVAEISRQLKLLAGELDVPVLALSQLNRGPEQRADKKPVVSDLRESGAIENDADMVILLHREDAYEPASQRAGEVDVIIGKHRGGPQATITVAAQLHYSRLVDMTKDEPN